jgi:ubiquinone/menaquinone biosynthesis C-methylase UbiE
MTVETDVAGHYSLNAIESRIDEALRAAGKDLEHLAPDDLALLDEFHQGDRTATEAFARQLGLQAGMRLLDIGSGLGGPARYFARHHGCDVTGIDLTDEFVTVARSLTRRLGLEGRVRFENASGTAMPFAAASFDAATLIHVGMNIADKAQLFREVKRVLVPGGVLGIYDQMREAPGDPTFPLPWATTPEVSFLDEPETYRRLLTDAGFEIISDRRCRDKVLTAYRRQRPPLPGEPLPPLGRHVTMGPGIIERGANFRIDFERGLIGPYEIVARSRGA